MTENSIFKNLPELGMSNDRICFMPCRKEVVQDGRCQCHNQLKIPSVLDKIKSVIEEKTLKKEN